MDVELLEIMKNIDKGLDDVFYGLVMIFFAILILAIPTGGK